MEFSSGYFERITSQPVSDEWLQYISHVSGGPRLSQASIMQAKSKNSTVDLPIELLGGFSEAIGIVRRIMWDYRSLHAACRVDRELYCFVVEIRCIINSWSNSDSMSVA